MSRRQPARSDPAPAARTSPAFARRSRLRRSAAAVLVALTVSGCGAGSPTSAGDADATPTAAAGLPVTLAVAADGRVVDRQVGPVSAARLEELVSRVAAEATAP